MGQVIVSFIGVCTYIRKSAYPDFAPADIAGRRWVLVNATQSIIENNPNLNRRTPAIDPHIPKLQLMDWQATLLEGELPFEPDGDTQVLDLTAGYSMSIINAIGDEIDDSELVCMPSLKMLAPDLGYVGPAVLDPTPATTACVFDFQSGRLQGTQLRQNGAGVTLLTIDTDGDPILEILPFGGTAPSLFRLQNQRTELPPGVNVMSFPWGSGKVDNPTDFYLHYLTAGTFPADATIQTQALTCAPCPFTYGLPPSFTATAGPECSNSGYP
jgi:hypothetical protein